MDSQKNSQEVVRLIVAYDGTDFQGWQKQVNVSSVQETIENVLSKMFNTKVTTIGSGRTDSGVHALAQNLHFRPPQPFKHPDLIYAMNRLLPSSIRVQKAFFAPDQFHAQHLAISKHYRYRLLQTKILCPLRRHQVWWPAHFFDVSLLNQVTSVLIGEHDFKSFQSSGTPVSSTVRKITHAEWTACGDELVFDVEGNGFLKQMVRNIVGACIHLAKKSETPIEDMKFLLDAKDRRQAPAPAPAQGLCLVSVQYPENIEEFCMPLPKKISY